MLGDELSGYELSGDNYQGTNYPGTNYPGTNYPRAAFNNVQFQGMTHVHALKTILMGDVHTLSTQLSTKCSEE
jgi:hypothetical protein